MSVEHERIRIPMDLDLKWTKEILIEQDKHLAKLIAENSKLREGLREGISLRDHFAGMAMQEFLALNKFKTALVVDMAYAMADAMMAKREKKDV
jgi:hypothetical protein